ncbi:MAG: glycosyltransferase family 4 protein [Mailhella sp.]|nr:glycosyltransferase family 4 protein [Mailhella sp.]
MMNFPDILSAIRRSVFLDHLNLRFKSRFSSRKARSAQKLAFAELVMRQGHEAFHADSPQIFIDISSLVGSDNQTGIHRLVRSFAACVSRMERYEGYRLSLVYASKYRTGYWHAFEYKRRVLDREGLPERDQPISFKAGDIFFELDWNMKLAALQRPFYERMVEAGVRVFFHVYDIIPLQLDDLFTPRSQKLFEDWLLEASRYTGVLCNSRAVAGEYGEWRQKKGLPPDFAIDWFHLGGDIENSHPSRGLPHDAGAVLEAMRATTSVLMVSALHSRKGYAQALEAFEQLWASGRKVKLVIVGKDLHMDDMARRLREHPEQGRRLIWLDNISDEYLDLVYQACSAVLFASRAEGFGLAVWEGARYGKALILRDLPVFRELAGESAFYFRGNEPASLATALEHWLALHEAGKAPTSEGIPILSWRQSVLHALDALIASTHGARR